MRRAGWALVISMGIGLAGTIPAGATSCDRKFFSPTKDKVYATPAMLRREVRDFKRRIAAIEAKPMSEDERNSELACMANESQWYYSRIATRLEYIKANGSPNMGREVNELLTLSAEYDRFYDRVYRSNKSYQQYRVENQSGNSTAVAYRSASTANDMRDAIKSRRFEDASRAAFYGQAARKDGVGEADAAVAGATGTGKRELTLQEKDQLVYGAPPGYAGFRKDIQNPAPPLPKTAADKTVSIYERIKALASQLLGSEPASPKAEDISAR